MPTKRLFLASLLLMPIGAQARFDAPAFFNACITDLTVKFAKDSQIAVPTVLADKFRRMCSCAANKTLNVSVDPDAFGMTATAFKSVSDMALITCIKEQ